MAKADPKVTEETRVKKSGRAAPSPPRAKEAKNHLTAESAEARAAEPILMAAIGAKDEDFYRGLMRQLTGVASLAEGASQRDLDFLLSVIKDIKPQNHIEALLSVQMVAVHGVMMKSAGQLGSVDPLRAEHTTQLFIKLARTFTAQMEALKRYRGGDVEIPATREEIEHEVLKGLYDRVCAKAKVFRPVELPEETNSVVPKTAQTGVKEG